MPAVMWCVTDLRLSAAAAAGKKYFGRGPMQLSWNYNVSVGSPTSPMPQPSWCKNSSSYIAPTVISIHYLVRPEQRLDSYVCCTVGMQGRAMFMLCYNTMP
jgi:hypothetical protein